MWVCITEKLQESGPEWRSFAQDEGNNKARAGAPTSLTIHESTDRNLRQVFSKLNRLKDKFAISDSVIEKTACISRKTLEKALVRDHFISALMVSAYMPTYCDTFTLRTLKAIE